MELETVGRLTIIHEWRKNSLMKSSISMDMYRDDYIGECWSYYAMWQRKNRRTLCRQWLSKTVFFVFTFSLFWSETGSPSDESSRRDEELHHLLLTAYHPNRRILVSGTSSKILDWETAIYARSLWWGWPWEVHSQHLHLNISSFIYYKIMIRHNERSSCIELLLSCFLVLNVAAWSEWQYETRWSSNNDSVEGKRSVNVHDISWTKINST